MGILATSSDLLRGCLFCTQRSPHPVRPMCLGRSVTMRLTVTTVSGELYQLDVSHDLELENLRAFVQVRRPSQDCLTFSSTGSMRVFSLATPCH